LTQSPASPQTPNDTNNEGYLLTIRLFGTPTILYQGKQLEINRLITRGLLYHLAASGGPVGRTRLSYFFWPDLSTEKARARLRDYLSKLRKILPDPSLLITSNQSVSLDFQRVYVDYLAFQKLQENTNRKSWARSATIPIPTVTYQTLLQLSDFHPDPKFLLEMDEIDSSEVSSWLAYKRQQLKSDYRSIIQRLYFYERNAGNLDLAINWLHTALSLDTTDEEVNMLLVRTMLDSGQREQAQTHFDQFIKGQDFGPSPELEALEKSLFDEVHDFSPKEDHPWPLHLSYTIPYVGQDEILAKAKRIYANGGSLLLLGEAGAGKTRLVKEIHQRIRPHPNLLLGTCEHDETNSSFRPWITLLLNHTPREVWMQLPAEKAAMLSVIIPELRSWRQDLESAPESITGRMRGSLFDAIYFLLEKIENNLPTMLFLDNIHCADQSSFDFIKHLLNHSLFRRANHLFIMTAQEEELRPELISSLKMYPDRVLEQVELSGLNESQVSEFVRNLATREPSKKFIAQITRATGGNPLFLLEFMHEVLNLPDPKFDSFPDLPLPKTIHGLFQLRLQGLSPDAVEVLQCAAVIGVQFDTKILEQAIDYPAGRFVDAMEELIASNLISPVKEGGNTAYTFQHEKFRESLLAEIQAPRLKFLHQGVADALVDSVNGDTEKSAVILAQHYTAAEEFSKAFDYWVQSAAYAYKLTSIKEAITFFDRAKNLIPRVKAISDEQLLSLYSRWTDVMKYQDKPVEVNRISQEWLSIGRQRNSDLLIGSALDSLSDACYIANELKKGLNYTEQAITYLERADNIYELLLAKSHQGKFLYMLGRLKESRDVIDVVLAQIPATKDENLILLESNLKLQLGSVDALMGYPVRGLQYLEQAIENKENIISPVIVTNVYTVMGLAHNFRGEFKSGYEICGKAIEIGEQIGYRRMCGYAYAYMAYSAHYLGYLGEAWELANKAKNIGEVYGHNEISALAYLTLGTSYQRLWDHVNAIQYFSKGLDVAGEHLAALDLMIQMGYSLACIGQVEEGLQYMTRAKKVSAQIELGSIGPLAEIFSLIVESQSGTTDDTLLERIEVALIDAKIRSLNRAVALLNIPFVRSNQNPYFILRQLDESLRDAIRLSDPLLQMRILNRIIIHKKEHGMSFESESEQLTKTLAALAPQAEGMPFENAWKNYSQAIIRAE